MLPAHAAAGAGSGMGGGPEGAVMTASTSSASQPRMAASQLMNGTAGK